MVKKLLVISDSHGHLGFISDVLKIELSSVDFVVHLGDAWFDMKPFINLIKGSGKKFVVVRGNVDLMRGDKTTDFIPEVEFIEVDGRKVLCTHGHAFEVHNSLDKLRAFSISNNSKVVLFGHTHQPFARKMDDIFFFNPGPLKDGIYGIVSLGDSISYKHYRLKNLPF
ncbi:MAG: YfcE family phosphodiesterase [Brevinematia bacterium]